MTTFAVLAVAVGLAVGRADGPGLAAPAPEHAWLQRLVGEWEFESEAVMAPGQPPVKGKGTETVRAVGGFWVVGEMKCEMMGQPMTGLMTVGYDAAKKRYVGTWVCSMCDWMCQYEGSVDSAGKTLTLNCEGPSPADPAKKVKMKDVVELKDKDTRVLTSSMLGEDGKWVPFMTLTAKRKK
jgi:hypothetical protein